MVDEARNESKKEQMETVLRFVCKEGLIHERFLDLVHVLNTTALTLKESICGVLSEVMMWLGTCEGSGMV